MALSYKAKRRWALIILVVGLPIYILLASVLATTIAPASMLGQLAIYVALGVLWIAPFKNIFLGIGQADPNAPQSEED